MESGCLFQPVLNGIGNTAAHGAPGIHLVDGGVIQLPQGREQTCRQGVGIRLLAIGQGIAAFVQWQLFFKAQNPVAGLKMGPNIFRSFLTAAGHDDHRLGGGIVTVFHAGGFHHLILVDLGGDSFVHHQVAQNLQQLLGADSAGAQQPGPLFRQIHDGGFHTHPAGTPVHDGGDFSVVVMADMFRCGGGGLAGNVGGGGGNGNAGKPDDLPGHIAVGAADSHGGQAPGGPPGNHIPGGEHDGQRAGPEFFRQVVGRLGDMMAKKLDLFRAGNVKDQGIVLGTALGFEDFGNGFFVQAVGSQTVDSLRRNGHQFTGADHFRCDMWSLCILGGQI